MPQQPGAQPQPAGPYGPPPQQRPGPYHPPAQAPGPYGAPAPGPYNAPAQPGPYGQQPGYGYPPQGYGYPAPPHQQPTQPQYAAPPPGGPGGGGFFRGTTRKVLGAALAVVLLAGAGIWFLTSGDKGGKPEAGPTHTSAPPTVSPSPTRSKVKPDYNPTLGPDAEARKINAAVKPGEAKVQWLQEVGVDLPGRGADVFGPWFVGDTVAKAMYHTVSGYSAGDGSLKWSVRLPTRMCAAPSRPTADGKIVLGILHDTSSSAACDTLQMIDLRTGKAGWRKAVVRKGVWDELSDLAMSINGSTVTVGRTSRTDAFRVGDGKPLFGKQPGACQPYAFASGPEGIAATSCLVKDDYKEYRLERRDPATGKLRWSYKVKKDWQVEHVYSTSPLIVASLKQPDKWGILVLNADGTYRTQLSGGGDDLVHPRCVELASLATNLDDCVGVTADATTFYMPTSNVWEKGESQDIPRNTVVAFDLTTGKPRWTAKSALGHPLTPLRTEGGKVLLYAAASKSEGGGIASLPSTGGTPSMVLRHPASGAKVERGFIEPRIDYVNGRSYLALTSIGGGISDGDEVVTRCLVAYGT
ncbi:PQQ-binding-like beta-propeller repeat protein [Streptomyces sp. ITFR-16]|uniref:outer membrane protein assembly factor BamB family protein n=1 Tax=Streptomyces sp. ITFR-16 TaxID=3075198 RepID=UPI00288A2EF1|nr:PQQ-binding-like beta-propeller repeat protein [Streptomyces sp. ITFR-16]WNI24334.1 PQQ-binding-like beta-propeller repeat protein [Streptomyces sp. ITFR-16]